jgi:hypothetical protein
MSRLAPPMSLTLPKSVSPGLIAPPPMAKTAILSSGAMTSVSHVSPADSIVSPSWSALTGASGVQVVASPDGSIWALSTAPAGANKYLWHFANGTWTSVPGLASQIAVGPTGTLYALNSAGFIYIWNGASWSGFAGGASAIAIAADGSIYVLSNGGGSGNQALWHNVSGVWTQVPGAGVELAASLDPNSYATSGGTVSGDGVYVLNAAGNIYYRNSSGTYVSFPGAASSIAPTTTGGFFVLVYPANTSSGSPIYYYNLNSPGWTFEPGAALSLSANGGKLYAISASDGIYATSIKVSGLAAGPGTALAGPTYGGDGVGYTPTVVANQLQYPVQQGYDGTGETVAIVIDSTVNPTDISFYLSYNDTPSRPRSLTTELVDGGSSGITGDEGEADLDQQTIAGLAPGANVIIYNIPSLDSSYTTDAYNQILSDGKAKIVNSSFGGCEYGGMAGEDAIFAAGAEEGVAFVSSSGDAGNECYNGSPYTFGVNFPSSDPNVTSAGGNETFPVNNVYNLLNPVVWNDSYFGSQAAGGGGVSQYWPTPGYQQGLAGALSQTFRNVPDISMPAIDTALYQEGVWYIAEGTSWSSPEYAALLAEVYEYCGTALENPVTVPYYVYRAAGYTAFLDVTSGNDQFEGTTPYYTAAAGYDNASGIGVPYGVPFAEAACPSSQPAAALQRPRSALSLAVHRAATPLVVDVTPRVQGLVDQGRRASSAQTRIQIVLLRTATLANDDQSVIQTLQNAGFTIAKTFSNHLVVDAEAPSATVERFFGTQMHDVLQGRYGTHYLPAAAVTVPPSISPYTAGVTLDDVITMAVPQGISALRFR